jgi:archaemetzincin
LNKQNILIISHGHFGENYLEIVAEDITREFFHPVKFKESHIDLSEFYDPTRRQYDGNKLLKFLHFTSDPDVLKTIGLFRVDLFIPILTYIFGQAVLNGKAGIVSTYRLKNEQYGMKKDEHLLLDRLRKVVIHELGHTFGLIHCHIPNCVMRSSTYVEDIDQKQHNLCVKCRSEVNHISSFS